MSRSKYWEMGFNAYYAGIHDCPLTIEWQYYDWKEGWKAAEVQAK